MAPAARRMKIGFSNVAMAITRSNMEGAEKLLLQAMASALNWNTWSGPIRAQSLLSAASMSESTLRRTLVGLEARGLISRTSTGGRRATIYHLHVEVLEHLKADWSQQEWRDTFVHGGVEGTGEALERSTGQLERAAESDATRADGRIARLEAFVAQLVGSLTRHSDRQGGAGGALTGHFDTPASIRIDPIDQERERSRVSSDQPASVTLQRESARSSQADGAMPSSMKAEERLKETFQRQTHGAPALTVPLSTDGRELAALRQRLSTGLGSIETTPEPDRDGTPPASDPTEARLLELIGLCIPPAMPIEEARALRSGVLAWFRVDLRKECARQGVPVLLLVDRALRHVQQSAALGSPPANPKLPLMKILHELVTAQKARSEGRTNDGSTGAQPSSSRSRPSWSASSAGEVDQLVMFAGSSSSAARDGAAGSSAARDGAARDSAARGSASRGSPGSSTQASEAHPPPRSMSLKRWLEAAIALGKPCDEAAIERLELELSRCGGKLLRDLE